MTRTFGSVTQSSRSAKFHEVGSYIVGILLSEPVEAPVTDISTGKAKVWDDGKPVTQWIFTLLKTREKVCQCDEWCSGGEKTSDYGTEDDDGVRKMYVASSQQTRAIAQAVREAGVRSGTPEVGATLAVQFVSYDREKQKPGRKPPKSWAAQYKRPTDETLAKAHEANGAGSTKPSEASNAMLEDLLASVTDDEPPKKMALADMKATSLEDVLNSTDEGAN